MASWMRLKVALGQLARSSSTTSDLAPAGGACAAIKASAQKSAERRIVYPPARWGIGGMASELYPRASRRFPPGWAVAPGPALRSAWATSVELAGRLNGIPCTSGSRPNSRLGVGSAGARGVGPGAVPGPTERGGYFFSGAIVPPFALQSAALALVIPWPLHAFLPAHALWADAHDPWPLHALMPAQRTWSPPIFSSARATAAPVNNRAAAALAMKMPFALIRSPP